MTHLTDREREVVELIGRDGAQYGTVARLLGISVHTVRAYVRQIAARVGGDRSPRESVVVLYHRECVTVSDTADSGGF